MILDQVFKIIINFWLSKAIALLRQCIEHLQNIHLNLLNAVNVLCDWISWHHPSLVSFQFLSDFIQSFVHSHKPKFRSLLKHA